MQTITCKQRLVIEIGKLCVCKRVVYVTIVITLQALEGWVFFFDRQLDRASNLD